MFKGFGTKQEMFHGFPNLNFGMNNQLFGVGGCIWHFDAAFEPTVSRWNASIGDYYLLQNTAAKQPTINSSDANFNNLPSVTFNNGTDTTCDNMAVNTTTLPFPNQYTFFWVFKIDGLQPARSNRFLCTTIGSGGAGIILTSNSNTALVGVLNGSGSVIYSVATDDTNPHIVVVTSTSIIIDGAVDSNGLNNTGLASVVSISQGSGGLNFAGTVAEFGCFNQLLTDAEAVLLCDTINAKYAIY